MGQQRRVSFRLWSELVLSISSLLTSIVIEFHPVTIVLGAVSVVGLVWFGIQIVLVKRKA